MIPFLCGARGFVLILLDLNTCHCFDFQDATIDLNSWAKQFRDYLRVKELSDEEIILKFLVLTQALVNADKQVRDHSLMTSRKFDPSPVPIHHIKMPALFIPLC